MTDYQLPAEVGIVATEKAKRYVARASEYLHLLPGIRTLARTYGYAITVHGSMARDLDIVAIPWVEDASPAEVLVEAIRVDLNAIICDRITPQPEIRAHGRLAWSMYFDAESARLLQGPYLDISVMPLGHVEPCAITLNGAKE